MPLYEYECAKDGRFELIRKFSDPPLTRCPTCGKKVEKLLSSPAFQFKGTGWYVTDYARKGNGSSDKDAKDGGQDSGKDSGKDSAKDSGKESAKDSGKDSGKSASASKTDSSSSSNPSPKAAASGSSSSGSSSSKS